MVPDEAAPRADSIVTGEAETVWPRVLRDAARGALEPRYAGGFADLANPVIPRRDLLSPAYRIASIQTSRGCPFDCEFCSVKAFNGPTFRQRAIGPVLDEMAAIPQRRVFFVDDNLIGYSRESLERAKQLFREMIRRRLRKSWLCQTSINFADDDALLSLAARSGCVLALVGIESVEDAVLGGAMGKRINRRRGSASYADFVRRCHRHGIVVLGTMVFGSDESAPDVFEQTARFYDTSGLDVPWPGFLTPYPGTRLHERLAAAGRLRLTRYPDDWRRYNETFVIDPPHGSARTFFDAFQAFTRRQFAARQAWRRALRVLGYSRSPMRAMLAYSLNRSLAARYRHGLTPPDDVPAADPAPEPRRRA